VWNGSQVSFDQWQEFATRQLPWKLEGYGTMQRLVETLTKDSARAAMKLLATRFIRVNRPVRFAEPAEKRLARFLAAEGALISVDENNFTIPSPLMHTYLTDKVVSMDKRKSPHEPVPFGPGDCLDIPELIRGALQAFNVEAMVTARRLSYKQGAGPGLTGVRVPSETAYHAELRNVFASWLPTDVEVASEVHAPSPLGMSAKSGRPPRCNLVIDSAQHVYALELMASGDEHSVKEHIKCLKEYKTALNAEEGWLIHFTLSPEPFVPCESDLGDASIKVITISHSFDWVRLKMHVTGESVKTLS